MVDLYYAIWSNIMYWPFFVRVMLVLAIVTILVYMLVWLVLSIGGTTIGIGVIVILRMICAIVHKLLAMNKRIGTKNRVRYMNAISRKVSSMVRKIEDIYRGMRKIKGGRILFYLVIYLGVVFLILFPEALRGHMNERYVALFSGVRDAYCMAEDKIISKAKYYDPLFIAEPEGDETGHYEDEAETEVVEMVDLEERWLELSAKGYYGAYIRSGPGTDYEAIGGVQGDIQLLYIKEQNNWFFVETQEGLQGWISGKLVKEVEYYEETVTD